MSLKWKRIVLENINSETDLFNGIGAFMCPYCYNTNYCMISYNINFTKVIIPLSKDNFKSDETTRYSSIIPQISYGIECEECSGIFSAYDIIDPNIAPIISILNKKGYKTKFCCEGHNTDTYANIENPENKIEYNESEAYIVFINDDYITSKIKSSVIPDPWFLDLDRFDDGSCCISCNHHDNEYLDYRLSTIKAWAESLDDISKR